MASLVTGPRGLLQLHYTTPKPWAFNHTCVCVIKVELMFEWMYDLTELITE
ncbi:hypothetical protein JOQ06_011955, partial [Pogonophryne albipinna]